MEKVRWTTACSLITLLAVASLVSAQPAPVPDAATTAATGTLDRIRQAGRIRVGYRTDARPLSYRDESGKAAGYAVGLGERVVQAVQAELGVANLPIEWVPVTAENRFQTLQQGEIDLLCGADTATLARRGDVAFSIPIFPGGIGALLRADAPADLRDVLAGQPPQSRPLWRGTATQILQAKTFAAVTGTTAATWLQSKLSEFKVTAKVTPVDGYDAGVQQLLARKCDVFFGDRAILLDAATRNPKARDLVVLDRLFTYEPLAFALARGDEDFRLIVDRTLSRLYRSGDVNELYTKWCGDPSDNVLAFFRWNALPD